MLENLTAVPSQAELASVMIRHRPEF
uniref:Uncharacterized protein n=1 Tax=Arundo donax TaxID=35708 RepID=A0A0A9H353_ARUDO